MSSPDYLAIFKLLVPEAVLVLVALAVLAADFFALREQSIRLRMGFACGLAAAGCVVSGILVYAASAASGAGQGMFVSDPLVRIAKLALLGLAVPTLAVSSRGRFTRHAGEYAALVLFAVLGMMLLVSSENLLTVFLSLEMTSLCLYVLTAFNQREARSTEAALKYFLFGGISAAVALFGFSLLYGLTGTLQFQAMGTAVSAHAADPLLWVALTAVVGGFGFKIAAVPFHLWAPDAYQGAPTPSAALIATGSKVASFFILAKLLWLGLAGAEGSAAWGDTTSGWALLLALLAVASMVLGNLVAIVQRNVKRLLAYSAIAHAGYMLLALLAGGREGMTSLVYYVVVYGAATLGAFTVVAAVEESGEDDSFQAMAGLSRREPVLALCLMLFLLSLAGIPPLAGFFGKFYIFVAAAQGGPAELSLLWLVIIAIAASVVSLYYYLMVLKQAFVADPHEGPAPAKCDLTLRLTAAVLALVVLGSGCFPSTVLSFIQTAFGVEH